MNLPTPEKPSYRDHGPAEVWTIWEMMHRLRLLIVTGSLIAPILILSRSKVVQEYWDQANPTRQAERLISDGKIDPTNASVLERACDDSPNRPDLLRALANACGGYDPARARRCYEQIEKLGATKVEDIAGRALLMARLHSYADAEAILDGSAANQASSQLLLHARLTVKVQSGDTAGALVALENLCRATPDDPDPAFEAAASFAKEGADSALIAKAELHVIPILSRWNDAERKSALNPRLAKLLELPLQDPSSREAAHVLLTKLHDPLPTQMIASATLGRPASFSSREQDRLRTVYIETSRRRGGISSKEKNDLAEFLQRQGDHSLVVELIPATESLTERALFQRRLTSMLHLGQWREAADLVSTPKAPATSYCQSLFFALNALNKAPVATIRTSDLLIAALRDCTTEGHAEACYSIGCAALEMDLQTIAAEAFACAVHLSPSDAQILEGMINASRRGGLPLKNLNAAISRGLGSRTPAPLVAQRLCYLHLLAQDHPEAARKFMLEHKENPVDPVYVRFLDALENYQHGDFAGSFHLLTPLPDYCWHQGEAAVIIGIVCSAGGADNCAPLAKNINPAKLFPEERAIVAPWLARLSLLGQNTPDIDRVQMRMAQR